MLLNIKSQSQNFAIEKVSIIKSLLNVLKNFCQRKF